MIYTIFESSFINKEQNFLNYRVYKTFSFENFKGYLSNASGSSSDSFDEFDNIFTTKLNKHAPKEKKLIRGSSKCHINRNLGHAMKMSSLKNIANKTKNPNDIKNYKRQRNYVVNLNKNAKFEYFNRLNSKESKPFWVSCKPYLSNKHSKADTGITFTENVELVLKNNKITDSFNEYFETIVEDLDLHYCKDNSELLLDTKSFDRVNNVINKYKNYPRIKNIKKQFQNFGNFSFRVVSLDEVKKIIQDLKKNKFTGGGIAISILKGCDFAFEFLKNCIDKSVENGSFPNSLKEGNITPIFKKDDPLDKSNYRPASTLPLFSKVYEKLIYNQPYD